MSARSATCITCARPLAPDETVSGFCPECLFRAGSIPHLHEPGGEEAALTSSWSEAFPQFEGRQVLRESDGFLAMTGSLISDDFASGHGPAVLILWSGSALAAEGGEDLLLSRIETLRLTPHLGLAPLVEAGDLAGRVYLFAKLPAGAAPWSDPTPLLPDLGRLLASVRAMCGIDLQLDPALLFRDEDGAPILVPQPVRPADPISSEQSSGDSTTCERAPRAGLEIGPYLLRERIGEGGFGEVWRARQERPATRTVALKILKQGLTSPRMRARFEVEQQALARLDHPHVARFFDGGTTPDGRPFFAMEWIEGSDITDYCREAGFSPGARLRLFDQVCEAVQHAHRKGIIHRDLKPSNVMVTVEDGEPAVKVIDFGIARALEEPLTDRTLLTRAEEIVGTPASMSPEQASGAGGGELDARTDVYGLGVLLYELLCDQRPFDESLPPDELRRAIREDDPPRPSSRSGDAERGRSLRGDLDWIVMRCLEKEPERRYDSVAALADDLARHHRHEPVVAGPPELSYRFGKFVRRHRFALAAATVTSCALVAGGIATVYGLITARNERANAVLALEDSRREAAVSEAVNRFLAEELLTLGRADGLPSADPRNHDIPLRTVLERAEARIEGRFQEMPEVEAALRHTIAASFFATGDFERAGGHAERAATLRERTLGEDDRRTLETLRLLASIRTSEGKTDEAQSVLDRIVSITGERPGGIPETRPKAESDVLHADLLFEKGDPYAAAGGYLSALKSEKLPPRLEARALSGYARGLEYVEPRSDVLARHQRAVVFAEKSFGKDDALTLEIVRRYARFLGDLDFASFEEVDRFAKLMKEVIARQVQLLGKDHPDTLRSRFDYALANGSLEVLAPGALRELETIVSAAQAHYPDDHPEALRFQLGLATQLSRGTDHQGAIERLESIVAGGTRAAGESHPVVVDATRQLGEACLALGKRDDALAHLRSAVTRARDGLSPTTPARQEAVLALGSQLSRMDGGAPEAIEIYHDEFLASAKRLGPNGREHRLAAGYLDRALAFVEHDRTGGLTFALAERATQVGGTPPSTIRSLHQLSLASQLALRPSLFAPHATPPLPEAYFRLLVVESMEATMENTGLPKIAVPPQVVALESQWRFLAIGQSESPPPGWQDPVFDDTAWRSGAAPIGFGEPGLATDLRAGRQAASPIVSACFRKRFAAPAASESKPTLLRLRCDDGAIVYLNGKEVVRFNVPAGAPPDQDLRASSAGEARTRDFLIPAGHLVRGDNVLAAQVFQHSIHSSDVVFSAALHTDAPLPMERLQAFDPEPASSLLDQWVPALALPLETHWREQAICMQSAILGRWEEALEECRKLTPRSAESAMRLRWFQQTALRRLGRAEAADTLFRQAVPARDSSTPAELIDLSAHYNALVTEPWHLTAEGMGYEPFLENFPAGTGSFDGISFDARGILQLIPNNFQGPILVRSYPHQSTQFRSAGSSASSTSSMQPSAPPTGTMWSPRS